MLWAAPSLCSWLYADSLDNLVQDAQPLSSSLTQNKVFPRSSRWRRCQAYRLPVDTQFLSYTRIDFLLDISMRYVFTQWVSSSFPPWVSQYWCSYLHLNATLENSMLWFHSNLSQRVSPYWWDPNSNSVLWASPGCKMHSNPVRLETDRQSATQNSSLVFDFATTRSSPPSFSSCINQPLRHDFRVVSWTKGCKRTSKNSWCWTNGEDDSIHLEWICLSSTCLRVGFSVSTYLIWILVSKLILSHNRSSTTLWVRNTCLIVGLRFLMISWLPHHYLQKCTAGHRSEKVLRLWQRDPHWIIQYPLGWWGSSSWCFCFSFGLRRATSLPVLVGFLENETLSMTRSPRSTAGIPSMLKPAPKERTSDSVELREKKFDSYTSNFWKRMFDVRRYINFHPKLTWSLQGLQRCMSLGTNPTRQLLCGLTHMTILSVVTRVMIVRDQQTSQAFVTSSCSFCDCSCKFVYRPQNVRGTNSW